MPKERRIRSTTHDSSVKLKRTFAVQDNAVEHVEIGAAQDVPAEEIMQEMTTPSLPLMVKKKVKQAAKRELLLERIEAGRAPYSKSHARRVKRKARERLADQGMDDMRSALAALDVPPTHTETIASSAVTSIHAGAGKVKGVVTDEDVVEEKMPGEVRHVKTHAGKIGQGKGAPLSKSQRKRAFELEKLRLPLILTNPDFSGNPFQTIRTHAQNTLLKHQVPST